MIHREFLGPPQNFLYGQKAASGMGYILDWERKEEKRIQKTYINVKDKAAMDSFSLHEREEGRRD